MALLEAGLGDRPIEVNASDASEAALARARRGVYRERSFRVLLPSHVGEVQLALQRVETAVGEAQLHLEVLRQL